MVVGYLGVVGVEAFPGVFFPRKKEDGGGFSERLVVAVMVPLLFLVDPHPIPELGILWVLTEEEE